MKTSIAIFLPLLVAGACDQPSGRAEQPSSAATAFRPHESEIFKIRMSIPADWTRETGYKERWGRGTGFLQLDATTSNPPISQIEARCRQERDSPDGLYGPDPEVRMLVLDGQPACRIASRAAHDARAKVPVGYVVLYPEPVSIPVLGPGGRPVEEHRYPHLLIWVDRAHAELVEHSLRFVR